MGKIKHTNNMNTNTQLIERENIENSPLWIIGNEEKGYFIAMGNNRITEFVKTKDEAHEQLNTHFWKIIAHIITIISLKVYDEQRNLSTTAENE